MPRPIVAVITVVAVVAVITVVAVVAVVLPPPLSIINIFIFFQHR
jgi:hypothetical protein